MHASVEVLVPTYFQAKKNIFFAASYAVIVQGHFVLLSFDLPQPSFRRHSRPLP